MHFHASPREDGTLVALMSVGWLAQVAFCRGLGVREAKQRHVKQADSPRDGSSLLSSEEQLLPRMDFPLTVGERWVAEEKQGPVGLLLKVPGSPIPSDTREKRPTPHPPIHDTQASI